MARKLKRLYGSAMSLFARTTQEGILEKHACRIRIFLKFFRTICLDLPEMTRYYYYLTIPFTSHIQEAGAALSSPAEQLRQLMRVSP
jgi:hypothetical protein